jgi:hypothetical protein
MKHYLKAAILASVGAALAVQTAQAQNTYNSGDMLLSFELAGQGHDVIFDLGSASQFNGTTSFDLSTVGFNSSLVETEFGVSSFANIRWSVTGYNPVVSGNQTDNEVFATKARTSPFTVSTSFHNTTSTALELSASQIDNLGGEFSLNAGGNSALSSTATAVNSTHANSVTKIQGTAGKLNGTFQGSTLNFGTTGLEGSDLYIVQATDNGAPAGNAQGDGFFTLNPVTGDMNYVVPEPSTYALVACAGLMFLAVNRKLRRQTA